MSAEEATSEGLEEGLKSAWLDEHREQLEAIGLPDSRLAELCALVCGRAPAEPFVIAPSGDGVLCSSDALRVSGVQALFPLHEARWDSAVGPAAWIEAIPASKISEPALALLDPLGLRMRHSATPTHRVECFRSGGKVYSVAWPLPRVKLSDDKPIEATRDYLHGRFMLDAPAYRAMQCTPLLSWPARWASAAELAECREALRARKVARESGAQARSTAAEAASTAAGRLPASASSRQVFLSWLAQQPASQPHASQPQPASQPAALAGLGALTAALAATEPAAASARPAASGPWRVFTDLPQVKATLSADGFGLVDSRDEAHIWWTGEHISAAQFGEAKGNGVIFNQFPHESVLTSKNLLAECVAARHGRRLPWMADTFTLPQQLPQFIDHWRGNAADDSDAAKMRRVFIMKPWSASRSEGHVIVHELAAALSLCNAAFGPRLACSYVERPLLLSGRKFDIRLYVAVSSLSPPAAHLYDGWYGRMASEAYEGAPLHQTAAHLTVCKYGSAPQAYLDGAAVVETLCAEQPHIDWDGVVLPRLHHLLADTVMLLVERGEASSPWARGQCRAVYGIDVIFAEEPGWQRAGPRPAGGEPAQPQPVLLEVNYSPDYGGILRMRPDFVNDVFSRLFGEAAGERQGPWVDLPLD